jgi:uncharacterized protein (DUF1697 family)
VTQLIALLRGINLASRNRISMGALRELLEDMGYQEVRTLLQSGNVVLTAEQSPEEVARAIEREIAKRLGLSIDVIVRTAEELASVVAANPLGDVATDGSKHFVVFLSEEPDQARLGELDEQDFAPERFRARGREVFVWCPNGMRDSPLLKVLGKQRLARTATMRNWNTVAKLAAMTGSSA